jgi:hypothetical protein
MHGYIFSQASIITTLFFDLFEGSPWILKCLKNYPSYEFIGEVIEKINIL